MSAPDPNTALVVFSGGQDSTTCLAWALERFERVETVGFAYGQRHAVEMECRAPIRARIAALNPKWAARLGADHVIDLGVLGALSRSSLTSDLPLGPRDDGLPSSFVPGRNLAFFTFAAIIAYQRGLKHVVTGVCETDYSGYPDCRDDTIKALQVALNLGMEARLVLDTPLMWVDKAQTWAMAQAMGGDALIALIRTQTHTCYLGERRVLHDWGYGCAQCPACVLRLKGFMRWRETLKRNAGREEIPDAQ